MTTETKPAPLKVTWTRPAEIIEAVTWNTLRLKVDLGFHTWRRVSANLTEGWFGSPSEAADFVQKWVESHTELIVRTQKLADDKRSLVTSYLVQVQGKHQQTGERDDLRYDLTRAMRPRSKTVPGKPETLAVDWTFAAEMTRLIDGDTQELTVDAGFHTDRAVTLRLLGVNTPETKGETRAAGLAASEFARQWYESHDDLVIQTRKDVRRSTDAFRRYLVTVEGRNTNTNAREDLAQALLGAHQAVPFMEDNVR